MPFHLPHCTKHKYYTQYRQRGYLQLLSRQVLAVSRNSIMEALALKAATLLPLLLLQKAAQSIQNKRSCCLSSETPSTMGCWQH